MLLGSGDPSLQKKRKARLMEPAGGLHCDEDVPQLQPLRGDLDVRVSPALIPGLGLPPAAVGKSHIPRGAEARAGGRMRQHADFD